MIKQLDCFTRNRSKIEDRCCISPSGKVKPHPPPPPPPSLFFKQELYESIHKCHWL